MAVACARFIPYEIMSLHLEAPQIVAPNQSLEHPWYVLHVRANREKSVSCALRDRGFTEFLPLYAESHRWSDRMKEVHVPLFRGYIFCRFNPQHRLPILQIPGVISPVGKRGIPEAVEEEEMIALQSVVRSGLLLQPWPFLTVGERVIIQHGPLRDVHGILKEIKGERKLVVSVSLLQRSVAVELERADVRPTA